MQQKINKLKDHIIVVGFGRTGIQTCEELRSEDIDFVVLDKNEATERACAERNYLCLIGDAEEDDIVEQAGVHRARGMIVATGDDATNAFVTMTARALSPELYIIARADEDAALKKLKKAGADRVLNPYAIGGRRLAHMMIRPDAIDFVTNTLRQHHKSLGIVDVEVQTDSNMVNQSLRDLDLRRHLGVSVIAIIRDGKSLPNPDPDLILEPNDHLIALGEHRQTADLKTLAAGESKPQ